MTEPSFRLDADDRDCARLSFLGDWVLEQSAPTSASVLERIESGRWRRLVLDTGEIGNWDSLFVSHVRALVQLCDHLEISVDQAELPAGVKRLLDLAPTIRPQAVPKPPPRPLTARLTAALRRVGGPVVEFLSFLGESADAFYRLLIGRANIRGADLLYFIEQGGPRAIPILTLIAVLVGMILAYMGSVQLRHFGAQIYVANLVSVGMAREMGAFMTAIILAGRTGAAYAAQLGSMQSNDEIDALKIMGISPAEFLVLPRTLALLITMPLLTIYADFMGMVGGGIVATSMHISPHQYLLQTQASISVGDITAGVAKSFVFAIAIALAGCRWGMCSGRSSAAVGEATTSAVVSAIVYIVVIDSIFNIIYDKLGI